MNLARRTVGFACLAICILSIGVTTLLYLSFYGVFFSIIAVISGICAAISLRP